MEYFRHIIFYCFPVYNFWHLTWNLQLWSINGEPSKRSDFEEVGPQYSFGNCSQLGGNSNMWRDAVLGGSGILLLKSDVRVVQVLHYLPSLALSSSYMEVSDILFSEVLDAYSGIYLFRYLNNSFCYISVTMFILHVISVYCGFSGTPRMHNHNLNQIGIDIACGTVITT